MQPRILIADDQADILSALRLLLKREGFDVATATSPAGVLDIVAREPLDVALIDLNYARDTTSGAEGLEPWRQLLRLNISADTAETTAPSRSISACRVVVTRESCSVRLQLSSSICSGSPGGALTMRSPPIVGFGWSTSHSCTTRIWQAMA